LGRSALHRVIDFGHLEFKTSQDLETWRRADSIFGKLRKEQKVPNIFERKMHNIIGSNHEVQWQAELAFVRYFCEAPQCR